MPGNQPPRGHPAARLPAGRPPRPPGPGSRLAVLNDGQEGPRRRPLRQYHAPGSPLLPRQLLSFPPPRPCGLRMSPRPPRRRGHQVRKGLRRQVELPAAAGTAPPRAPRGLSGGGGGGGVLFLTSGAGRGAEGVLVSGWVGCRSVSLSLSSGGKRDRLTGPRLQGRSVFRWNPPPPRSFLTERGVRTPICSPAGVGSILRKWGSRAADACRNPASRVPSVDLGTSSRHIPRRPHLCAGSICC